MSTWRDTKANVWSMRLKAKHQDEQHFCTCLTALFCDYAICSCIIQRDWLKKKKPQKPTKCTRIMLHSSSSHAGKQIRFCFSVMQLEDVLFGCKDGIHAWQTGRISKGKRTASRWEHGSYRQNIGPNHVKIHLYGWIPTLIKQNC